MARTVFNLNQYKKQVEAAQPMLGIFWIYRGQIIEFSVPAAGIPPIGGFKDSSYDHAAYWKQVCSMHPELKGKEYWTVPRGRVTYTANGVYHVVMSTKNAANRILLARIMRLFNLPQGRTIAVADAHYNDMPQNMDDFDD